jgi:hypothetical protein
MEVVFLAYSYGTVGREVARNVELLVSNQDVRVVTGEVLEGQPLTPAVQNKIANSDALIAVLTPEVQVATPQPGWMASNWVRDELMFAGTQKKATIAFVHRDVGQLGGMLQGSEYINYDPAEPLAGFLKLAATVGAWKVTLGRRMWVRVLPMELERELGLQTPVTCEYRLTREADGMSIHEWRQARLQIKPGGAFAFLENVQKDALIELKIAVNNRRWGSRATPQWYHVQLEIPGA